jgi:hypothetical protein
MANDNNKPQGGNAGTGARAGDASPSEQDRDAGGGGERGGAREENEPGNPRREQGDTKPPRRRP